MSYIYVKACQRCGISMGTYEFKPLCQQCQKEVYDKEHGLT